MLANKTYCYVLHNSQLNGTLMRPLRNINILISFVTHLLNAKISRCEIVGLVFWPSSIKEEVDMVLKLVNRDFLNKLTKIIVGIFEPQDTDDNALTLSIDSEYTDALKVLNLLLRDYNLSHRNPQVHLKLSCEDEKECDVIRLITEAVRDLHRY